MNFSKFQKDFNLLKDMGYIVALAGLAAAGIGYAGTSSTNSQNKKLAAQSTQDELDRREAASKELEKAFKAYNKLREERPGVSFGEFKNEYVGAISDPRLREAFNNVKQQDFELAQSIATQSTVGNLANYGVAYNAVSGGYGNELRDTASEIALSDTSEQAYNRALQLYSKSVPAGTVRYDANGKLVESSGAAKRLFNIAFETDQQQRDIQFRRSRDLANDFAAIADRNTERAKDFLQFAGLEPVARGFALQAIENRIANQRADEAIQFGLIQRYAAAASGGTPATPAYQDGSAYAKLMSQGIDTAIKGIAQANNNNNNASLKTGSSTGSYL